MLEAFARKLMARKAVDRFASAPAALEMLALFAHDRVAASRVLEVRARPRIALPAIVAPVDAAAATHRWLPDVPTAIVVTPPSSTVARWTVAIAVTLLGVANGWGALT